MKENNTNHQIIQYIAAVFLGLAIVICAVAAGGLYLTMSKASKARPYTEKPAEEQAETIEAKEDELFEEEEDTIAYRSSMEGFQAGNAKISNSSVATGSEQTENLKTEETTSPEETKKPKTTETQLEENDEKEEAKKDYILPDSDSKYYTKNDLKKLTQNEVRLARNEIYARRGRKFETKEIREYFEGKGWYHGTVDEVSDTELNQYEIANRDLIIQYEKDKGWK